MFCFDWIYGNLIPSVLYLPAEDSGNEDLFGMQHFAKYEVLICKAKDSWPIALLDAIVGAIHVAGREIFQFWHTFRTLRLSCETDLSSFL